MKRGGLFRQPVEVNTTYEVKQDTKEPVTDLESHTEENPYHKGGQFPCMLKVTNHIARGRNYGSVRFEVQLTIPCDYAMIDQATEFAVNKIDDIITAQMPNLNDVYEKL